MADNVHEGDLDLSDVTSPEGLELPDKVTGSLDLVAQRQDSLDQFGQSILVITGKARGEIQHQTGTVGSLWE